MCQVDLVCHLSLRQHNTTQWPTMGIARQDYAHATKLLSAVVDLGYCQKGRQAVVQVKPKGSKFKAGKATQGWSRFRKRDNEPIPTSKWCGKCCHLSQRRPGAESHKPSFFLAFYSSFPSLH